eukprot:573857_1
MASNPVSSTPASEEPFRIRFLSTSDGATSPNCLKRIELAWSDGQWRLHDCDVFDLDTCTLFLASCIGRNITDFLMVTFRLADLDLTGLSNPPDAEFLEAIKQVCGRGIEIELPDGKHTVFHFLSPSARQLSCLTTHARAAVFVRADSQSDARALLLKVGAVGSEWAGEGVEKRANVVGQLLTVVQPLTHLSPADYRLVDLAARAPVNGFCGAGQADEWWWRAGGKGASPSVLKVRFENFAGTLTVLPDFDGIGFAASMKQFPSRCPDAAQEGLLCVEDYSRPSMYGVLSTMDVILLSQRGVSARSLIAVLMDEHRTLNSILLRKYPNEFAFPSHSHHPAPQSTAKPLTQEQRLLWYLRHTRDEVRCYAGPHPMAGLGGGLGSVECVSGGCAARDGLLAMVQESRVVFAVPDPYGLIGEGQAYFRYASGSSGAVTVTHHLLVFPSRLGARSGACAFVHAGQASVLTGVDFSRSDERYKYLIDCLVVSVDGEMPAFVPETGFADCRVMVSWDKHLLPSKFVAPPEWVPSEASPAPTNPSDKGPGLSFDYFTQASALHSRARALFLEKAASLAGGGDGQWVGNKQVAMISLVNVLGCGTDQEGSVDRSLLSMVANHLSATENDRFDSNLPWVAMKRRREDLGKQLMMSFRCMQLSPKALAGNQLALTRLREDARNGGVDAQRVMREIEDVRRGDDEPGDNENHSSHTASPALSYQPASVSSSKPSHHSSHTASPAPSDQPASVSSSRHTRTTNSVATHSIDSSCDSIISRDESRDGLKHSRPGSSMSRSSHHSASVSRKNSLPDIARGPVSDTTRGAVAGTTRGHASDNTTTSRGLWDAPDRKESPAKSATIQPRPTSKSQPNSSTRKSQNPSRNTSESALSQQTLKVPVMTPQRTSQLRPQNASMAHQNMTSVKHTTSLRIPEQKISQKTPKRFSQMDLQKPKITQNSTSKAPRTTPSPLMTPSSVWTTPPMIPTTTRKTPPMASGLLSARKYNPSHKPIKITPGQRMTLGPQMTPGRPRVAPPAPVSLTSADSQQTCPDFLTGSNPSSPKNHILNETKISEPTAQTPASPTSTRVSISSKGPLISKLDPFAHNSLKGDAAIFRPSDFSKSAQIPDPSNSARISVSSAGESPQISALVPPDSDMVQLTDKFVEQILTRSKSAPSLDEVSSTPLRPNAQRFKSEISEKSCKKPETALSAMAIEFKTGSSPNFANDFSEKSPRWNGVSERHNSSASELSWDTSSTFEPLDSVQKAFQQRMEISMEKKDDVECNAFKSMMDRALATPGTPRLNFEPQSANTFVQETSVKSPPSNSNAFLNRMTKAIVQSNVRSQLGQETGSVVNSQFGVHSRRSSPPHGLPAGQVSYMAQQMVQAATIPAPIFPQQPMPQPPPISQITDNEWFSSQFSAQQIPRQFSPQPVFQPMPVMQAVPPPPVMQPVPFRTFLQPVPRFTPPPHIAGNPEKRWPMNGKYSTQ